MECFCGEKTEIYDSEFKLPWCMVESLILSVFFKSELGAKTFDNDTK